MSQRASSWVSYGLAMGFLLGVAVAVWASVIPALILWLYLAASLITFAAYALDKWAAQKDHWRTPEKTLHLLALAGGWPGALIARKLLRHKTRKQPFRAIFWVTVVVHCAAFALLLTPAAEEVREAFQPALDWVEDWLLR